MGIEVRNGSNVSGFQVKFEVHLSQNVLKPSICKCFRNTCSGHLAGNADSGAGGRLLVCMVAIGEASCSWGNLLTRLGEGLCWSMR